MIFPLSMNSSFSRVPLAMTRRPVRSCEACLTSSSAGVASPIDFHFRCGGIDVETISDSAGAGGGTTAFATRS